MPVYEYRCQSCEKTFEYTHSAKEAPREKCEACGGKLERLISRAGFILKGSGWYRDLYASPKPAAASESSAGDKGKTEKSESPQKSEATSKTEKAAPKTTDSGDKS